MSLYAGNQLLKNFFRNVSKTRYPLSGYPSILCSPEHFLPLRTIIEDIGVQAGEIALEIIGGKPPEEIPVVLPRKTNLYINLNIARILGIKIPSGIINKSKEVFGK